MNNKSIIPEAPQKTALLILLFIQFVATLVTLVVEGLQTNSLFSIRAWLGISITVTLLVIDLSWFMYAWLNRVNNVQKMALLRVQPAVAWLIYHSAVLPIILLTDRLTNLQTASLIGVHVALLVMGLLPIGLMFWLDRYLVRKFNV
ncbi:MAG: hypothetical protein PHC86_02730 [Eubacteriales bacterium]|nr:hypothetical protein [Eubacteriales bacterium]